ncbi:menaquinone-dependent protoporphyrinogen IX dehydrogenase [Sansalvadorimonas sp. 2012CJ34-2]|uniref:Protoporphyrinogen IX dehydrogenase [quinone] n=1 Tax=Parendozoicomonas callyspongiae TaxID=2942213 RepID=A0ABT0PN07_9GAMM|nr:menaquinone-dependent protoporphyrinogen IX dehydrogenase [Sansalvadorimonas sp. 2012CJ34-2]MCL6271858.1 menaquinone-dependent protoporphyrinogen IX dehydrogenase [Sansalvadorimonas sp. 2012CJ34-2]
MKTHLVLYASHDGQTARIAKAIQDEMAASGLDVKLQNLDELTPDFDPSAFGSFLITAPIRYGYHLPVARKFIQTHCDLLNKTPSGFLSVNLTARKPEKQDPMTNRYMVKFLKKSSWKPGYLGVTAGSLLYSRYNFFDSIMIQLIMKITKGSTDASKDIEYTDWSKVSGFAQGYIKYLKEAASA